MPLSFPLANNARAALETLAGARTIAEARELAGGPVTLVSEWLRPTAAEREAVQAQAEAGASRGFVQVYEDAKGRPVLAVTFWKKQAQPKAKAGKARGAAELPPEPTTPVPRQYDDTDDLYFSKPAAKARRRRRSPDPNQLELFTGPDQRGDETPDPRNPAVVVVDEEGSGTTFGLEPGRGEAATQD